MKKGIDMENCRSTVVVAKVPQTQLSESSGEFVIANSSTGIGARLGLWVGKWDSRKPEGALKFSSCDEVAEQGGVFVIDSPFAYLSFGPSSQEFSDVGRREK
ncbi:hypothetical protein [Pelagicoccus mobilis]|uniref:Uncharacterized protein n=1 Tax=Pelagicoccus mobilis TaxID=415221 RepID=A0A934S1K0_9BACT|nr:hypothetical protein [Pelagicoccus mobilis]MBK1877413.1 hypothetical protein [Pelagicoccus mobilis]